MSDVVENSPGRNMFSSDLDEVIIDGMEHEGQRLEIYQDCHQIVDLVNRVSVQR